MAENKKSFLLYCDIISTVEKLPKEKAGELFMLILNYVNDKNPETDDLLLQIAFEPIKMQLKRDLKKYAEILKKRSLAGKASADKRQQMSTCVKCVKQNSTNPTDNDNDNDNVTVIDIVKEKVKRKKIFIKPTIEEIKAYCDERKNGVDPKYFFDSNEAKGWVVGKLRTPIVDWKAVIRTWERNSPNKKGTQHSSILA